MISISIQYFQFGKSLHFFQYLVTLLHILIFNIFNSVHLLLQQSLFVLHYWLPLLTCNDHTFVENSPFPPFNNANSTILHQKIKELFYKKTESEIVKESEEENTERVKIVKKKICIAKSLLVFGKRATCKFRTHKCVCVCVIDANRSNRRIDY